MEVVIIDERKDWMKVEDKYMTCAWFCPLFKKCDSKFGADCKKFGGTEIPKIRR